MERNTHYTEDELVHLYQDGEITLEDLIENHPDGWFDEYIDFCARKGVDPDEGAALDFLDRKNRELEEALAESRA